MPSSKIIVLIGVQGSGKGTQAALLAKKFRLSSVSPGEIFRQAIKRGDRLGRLAASFINRGHLMPSAITNRVMGKFLSSRAARRGIILDGYPRDMVQARYLYRRAPFALAILFQLSDREAIRRLSGRRTCPTDGANYHLKFLPPKHRGLCDKCGTRLVRRADDTPQAIRKRLKIFHKETTPVIKFYRQRGRLLEVDGRGSIKAVFRRLIKKMTVFIDAPK